jgi:hypothetical protein
MKTQREIETAICEGISGFQQTRDRQQLRNCPMMAIGTASPNTPRIVEKALTTR